MPATTSEPPSEGLLVDLPTPSALAIAGGDSMQSSSTINTSSPSVGTAASISSTTKKAGMIRRFVKRISSGSKRRSSDDSTASASSQDLGHGSHHHLSLGKPVRVPATIPEQQELTKEQLDEALRDERIEKAASERDEKRKRRMGEALSSVVRRFETAHTIINAEMDENVESAVWSEKERKMATGIMAFVGAIATFGLFLPQILFILAFIPPCLLLYSYRNVNLRSEDMRQATDNVGARLDDLEDGIRRCMLALQHDLEADADWEASMKEEQLRWEERQKELQARRGRTLRNLNTRRKKFVESIRIQAAHLPEMHLVPEVVTQKARSFLEKANPLHRTRSASHLRASDSDGAGEIVTEPGASQAWVKYVHANLPSERLDHETDEEKEYAIQLRARTEGRWDRIPYDLQLMVLRGYADKKDRMKESLEAIEYIVHWREHTQADQMLSSVSPAFKDFCRFWYSRFGGEDRYGHIILFDRVQDLDLPNLYLFDDDTLLRHRTQQMEVMRHKKHQTTERRGTRVCKNIYIMDLQGLSMGKHFTPRVKNLLSGIFKVGGDGYPDSLWSLWLINTPMVFQVIWKILSPTIDSVTKNKIRMLGGKDKYIPEMEKCGIPRSSIPKEFGGDFESIPVYEAQLEIIEEEKVRQSEAPSAIPVAQETSTM